LEVIISEGRQFSLKLRYVGGTADNHQLQFYDGTTSIHGFAQALQIATHAYVNGEIVSRATALKGATLYVKAPRQGSVLFDVIAIIEKHPGVATLAAPFFYDFIKYAFCKAAGYFDVYPETKNLSEWSDRDEPFFDDLAETMEGSLQRAHRAIDEGVNVVTLERPRSVLVEFNRSTSQWVNTRDEDKSVEDMTGNVTRYNSITGNGRAFIDKLNRVIPFRLSQDFSDLKRGYLSWSLHGSTTALPKHLLIQARQVKSASDKVKRLILVDCNQAPDGK
jgi:hypothetical protein